MGILKAIPCQKQKGQAQSFFSCSTIWTVVERIVCLHPSPHRLHSLIRLSKEGRPSRPHPLLTRNWAKPYLMIGDRKISYPLKAAETLWIFTWEWRLLLDTANLGKESTEEKNTKENEPVMDGFLIHGKQRYQTIDPQFIMASDKNRDPWLPSRLEPTPCNTPGTASWEVTRNFGSGVKKVLVVLWETR